MKNIGFHGGHSMYVLGPASDVVLFFECVQSYAVDDSSQKDWGLITDRLYKRYLRQEELDTASGLMEQVKNVFAGVPGSAVQWNAATIGNLGKTLLDPSLQTLAEVFARYFEHFRSAVESAKSFEGTFKIYQPVKTIITDVPDFMTENRRPLEDYDALQGKPFWMEASPQSYRQNVAYKDGIEVPLGTPGSVVVDYVQMDGSTTLNVVTPKL